MWTRADLASLARTKTAAVVVASAFSAAAGATTAWLIAANKLEKKYAAMSEEEIEKAKVFYGRVNKVDIEPEDLTKEYSDGVKVHDPADLVKAQEITRTMKYHTALGETPAESEEDLVEETIDELEIENAVTEAIDESLGNFNIELERQNRTPDQPYVITHDEFMENEEEFEQAELTYFEGDDVLMDSADQMINDVENVVGVANLSFGFGSLDPNIVYVRNENIEMDFCITRSAGKYGVEVLGFDDELHHSDRPRIGKFRESRADG
ncbi:hypothetical protein [Flavobacterium sp.]|uniref:hypothetical protein n=1 Tax=Flavobacterium sp. TaxID=239 RepID=UPI0026266B32|nr:hypothetical protein [Flavobacterium sp.]